MTLRESQLVWARIEKLVPMLEQLDEPLDHILASALVTTAALLLHSGAHKPQENTCERFLVSCKSSYEAAQRFVEIHPNVKVNHERG